MNSLNPTQSIFRLLVSFVAINAFCFQFETANAQKPGGQRGGPGQGQAQQGQGQQGPGQQGQGGQQNQRRQIVQQVMKQFDADGNQMLDELELGQLLEFMHSKMQQQRQQGQAGPQGQGENRGRGQAMNGGQGDQRQGGAARGQGSRPPGGGVRGQGGGGGAKGQRR